MRFMLCLMATGLSTSLLAQTKTFTIKGEVTDAHSNEVLVGAIIQLNNTKTASQLDGNFSFKNIPAGTYTLRYKYIGYQPKDTTFTVSGDC